MSIQLKKGDIAPEFTLNNGDGNSISLADFKGKWVVLYYYPRDNTPGCTTEAKDFSASIDNFIKENAVVIGISKDSEKSHVKFREKHDLKVELLSDPEHEVQEKYGVWQLKKMAGREYMGTVRSTFLIDQEGKIAEVWGKVKVKGHVDVVTESLCILKSSGS